ncbi:MAG: arylesterase [Reyranellaceae bacterium]
MAYGAIAAPFNGRMVTACVAAALLWFAVVIPVSARAETLRIAMLGDSLTAGYGLPPQEALPVKLEKALKAAGRDVTIANHGVSGDTTAGGLSRVDWMMGDKPRLVLVALGANDALRGIDPAETERNLDAIITRIKAEGAAVMLFGMAAPRNFGPEYTKAFDGLYPRLAEKHKVPLYPFLLDGVAMQPDLNQADGIHPNPRGVDVLVKRIAPEVIKAIDALK